MPVEVQAPPPGARLLPQLLKSGAVGGVGFVVNLGVFNALMLTVFTPAHVHAGPIWATILATLVAIATNWLGNRFWAFSAQRQSNAAREGAEFLIVSVAGMGIPLACLWLSHYVLGYTSLISDNIANNGVGLALGMLFRFALYRWWVFSPLRASARRPADAARGSARPARHPARPAAAPRPTSPRSSSPRAASPRPAAPLPSTPDPGLVSER